jgi:WD40 repeat protein
MRGQYGMEQPGRQGDNYWKSSKVRPPRLSSADSSLHPSKSHGPLASSSDITGPDCVFHDDGNASSLYLDHECSSGQFPAMTTHILADHTDEVWKLEWSPDGTMLASAGKDHQVVIWQLKVCRPYIAWITADE